MLPTCCLYGVHVCNSITYENFFFRGMHRMFARWSPANICTSAPMPCAQMKYMCVTILDQSLESMASQTKAVIHLVDHYCMQHSANLGQMLRGCAVMSPHPRQTLDPQPKPVVLCCLPEHFTTLLSTSASLQSRVLTLYFGYPRDDTGAFGAEALYSLCTFPTTGCKVI